MKPIQFINSKFGLSFFEEYIKSSRYFPVIEHCSIQFDPSDIAKEHDKFLTHATWIIYVSRFDLDKLPAFIDQMIQMAEIKNVHKLIVILPMGWGISSIHKMIRAAAYRVCACHISATVVQYPLFYHEVFMNSQLLWDGGYLMLPIGKANVPWINVEVLLERIRLLLDQQVPHSQVNYLTHSVQMGGRHIASLFTKLSNQVSYQVYIEKLFHQIDLNQDGHICKQELVKHWQSLNWSSQEIDFWLDRIFPYEHTSITFENTFTPLASTIREYLDFCPQSFTYLHVSTAIALQEEIHTYQIHPDKLKCVVEYWKGLETHFIQAQEVSSQDTSELKSFFRGYFHLPQAVTIIPGEGIIDLPAQSHSDVSEQVQTITLRLGKTLTRTFSADEKVLKYEQGEENPSEYIIYPIEKEQVRKIGLLEQQLVYVSGEMHWSGWNESLKILASKILLPEWKQKLFRTTGELILTQDQIEGDPQDVLCNCTNLTRSECWRWMNEGYTTVHGIAKETQATTICGGCYPLIEEVVEKKELVFAEISDRYYLGGDITRLRIRPVQKPVVQADPGQHILLQGKMDNEWITRAYTLTATSEEYYEIAIKKEDNGKFSSWLSNQLNDEMLLRISAPRGTFTLTAKGGAVFFFAGGIGITPALAMIRTLPYRREERPFYLDWSVESREKLVFQEEIDYWEQRIDRFSRIFRVTSELGRLSQTTIQEMYPYQKGQIAYVCGPESYNHMVQHALLASGWPSSSIKVEVFTSISSKQFSRPKKPDLHRDPPSSIHVRPTGCPVSHHSFYLASPEEIDLYSEAQEFLTQCYRETGNSALFNARWDEVESSIKHSGSYIHTLEELTYGAKVAWRNSTRCIGRFFWDKLQVRDLRHLSKAEEMFEAILEHLTLGTNQGKITPMISIFPPQKGLRIWNSQLIQYAAYQQADGSIIGDPKNLELTQKIQELGWSGGQGTHFDLLPIVFQMPNTSPQWFEIPKDRVLEVPIIHPKYEWFRTLNLKWYALPAVSNMALDMGGIQYTLVPFNGFYMGTEIGARNFADSYRYNMLKTIAEKLELDTTQNYTLWKDVALVELNIAVLFSYQQYGIRMMDHHTLSEYFLRFDQNEAACDRPVYADWTWIVPPMSGSTVNIFHIDKWENRLIKPNYFYMDDPWKNEGEFLDIEEKAHTVHLGNYSG